MVRVICAVIVITGYAVLGYVKAKAKKEEDQLIEQWRRDFK
jgi:hypothetical protein